MKDYNETICGIEITWKNYEDKFKTKCIYRFILPTGRFYIGKMWGTKGRNVLRVFDERCREHINDAASGENDLFHRNLRREGKAIVEVLCLCETEDELDKMERHYIHAYSRLIYNTFKKEDTYYNTYSKYSGIINGVLLNTIGI